MNKYRCICLVICLLNLSCVCVKEVPDLIDLQVQKITSRRWVAGVEKAGSGYTVEVFLKASIKDPLELYQVYYKGLVGKLNKESSLYYTANLIDKETSKENQLDIIPDNYQKISDQQLLLIIKSNNKNKYYLHEQIDKLDPLFYPSVNQKP